MIQGRIDFFSDRQKLYLFQDCNLIFLVRLSVTTRPMPEFYGQVDAVKVHGPIHLLIHNNTVKELLPLLRTAFLRFQVI